MSPRGSHLRDRFLQGTQLPDLVTSLLAPGSCLLTTRLMAPVELHLGGSLGEPISLTLPIHLIFKNYYGTCQRMKKVEKYCEPKVTYICKLL